MIPVFSSSGFRQALTALCLLVILSLPGYAQNNLGVHLGVLHPVASFSEGRTTTLSDKYVVGFPIGITIKKSENFAFDFEFVPFISKGEAVHILMHPGLLFNLGNSYTFGIRAAFEINRNSYGFTPVISKSFSIGGGTALFGGLAFPVRFGRANAFTTAFQVGVGF